MTIIIETPAPPTRERLVLVPPGCPLPVLARDATPADLARGGYERLGPEVLRVSAAEWHAMKLRAEGREAHGEPGTLAHLRNDLRDAEKRAEKAERERDDLLARINDAEEAARALRAGLRAAADLLGGEPGPDVHRDYTDGGRASPRVSLATYADVVPSQQPSEASAVEVLRELVAWVDSKGGGFDAIIVRARRVLAASGPDPSAVVRAVETLREQAFRGPARRTAALEALLDTFDAYRKAGGK